MIFGDKYVFLELAKTGSTYARYVLGNLKKSSNKTVGKKHNVYSSLSKDEKDEFKGKVKVASIRNPFDWYVSLYAFACEHRGGLYTWTQIRPDVLSINNVSELFKVLINHIRNKRKWREVFSDVNSKENFENFLNLLFFEDPLGAGFRYELGGGSKLMGFYSYDYFRMCTYNFDENSSEIKKYEDLQGFHKENYILDIMLRNESLKDDLIKHANELCSGHEEMQAAIDSKAKRSNTATKRRGYSYYYNDRTIKLVMERDQFIFETYGYKFD